MAARLPRSSLSLPSYFYKHLHAIGGLNPCSSLLYWSTELHPSTPNISMSAPAAATPATEAAAPAAAAGARNNISLWVGDLAPEVTERELYQVFSAVRVSMARLDCRPVSHLPLVPPVPLSLSC